MAERLAPILLSLTPAAGGQLEALWSVRPGRRVRMYVQTSAATPDGLALIATRILPALERHQDAPRI